MSEEKNNLLTTQDSTTAPETTPPVVTQNASGVASGGAAATTGNTSGVSSTLSQSYNDYTADTINKIYDSQREAAVGQLKNSFNTNLREAEMAKGRIGNQYQNAMNQLSTEYERTRKNNNEYIAANGLNTGYGSQAALAQRSNYQRDFGNLGQAESKAMQDAEMGITNMRDKYAADMNSLLQNTEYQKATALLAQYKDDYNRQMAEADKRAALGDFGGYETLMGKDAADRMQQMWYAQNPDLAYMTGNVTKAQRDNLKNGRPINYGLDENGNKIAGFGGGGYNYEYGDWSYNGGGGGGDERGIQTSPGGSHIPYSDGGYDDYKY